MVGFVDIGGFLTITAWSVFS